MVGIVGSLSMVYFLKCFAIFVKQQNHGLRNRSKRVRIPVALLDCLSDKYPWESYEPPYPPSYGLDSTTTDLLE